MRKPFVAANWKMNTNSQSAVELAKGLADGLKSTDVEVVVYPPFVYLKEIAMLLQGSNIAVGAQDIYFEQNGAFTGEISAEMLKDVGCVHVLCGHSERRNVMGESSETVNKKVVEAINGGLLPTLCVGELLEQREANETMAVVTEQVTVGLKGLSEAQVKAVTIAYEPVWAIGTGLTATPQQAQDVHADIRALVAKLYNEQIANDMRIQYGGSVKPDNAAELMAKADIDGSLVGGAGLKVDSFLGIINAS